MGCVYGYLRRHTIAGRVHPKSGIDDQLRNQGGHAGLEGRVASVDGGAVLWVAQAVGAQKVHVGDHRTETVVVAGVPRVVGHMVLPRNGSGLGPEGAPQVVV